MLGLVLGGGAAKGYAHIGVIQVLEEEGIKPDLVVGASMGTLVGAFYAAGFSSSQMAEIGRSVDRRKKGWLFELRLSGHGLVDGKNVIEFLEPFLGGRLIEDLPVRYAAVATDIEARTEIIIDRGDLVQAVRAGISIPVVFYPHDHSGHILIDGGFVNPLPVRAAKTMGATKIIAVNVLYKTGYPQVPLAATSSSGHHYGMKSVLGSTISLIFSRLIDYQLEVLNDGLVINVDTDGISVTQFEKAREAIQRGYEAAARQRSGLKALVRSRPRSGKRHD
jgi:NTE family protein